tara:strand:+ start:200 stop:745 length:546 start_codon:yes stop_codon:yes gene_type:complete
MREYNPSELIGLHIGGIKPENILLTESELQEYTKTFPQGVSRKIPEMVSQNKEGKIISTEVKRMPDIVVRREGKISRREPECTPRGNKKFGQYRYGMIRHPLAKLVWDAVSKASNRIVDGLKISEHQIIFIFPEMIPMKTIERTKKMVTKEALLAIQKGMTNVKKVSILFGVMDNEDFKVD